MRFVVVGGTGLIGTRVAALLDRPGDPVVVASPSTGVDTVTGEGLRAAVAGADVVIDVTRPRTYEAGEVMRFFLTSTLNLLEAAAGAGVGHHVALSVVGAERLLDSAWFRAKIVQESLVRSGPIPYTVVRATQFFEFVAAIADHATIGAEVRVPPVRCQPVAAVDVAEAIADTVRAEPRCGVVEVAGPDSFRMPELVSLALAAAHDARTVVADGHARYFGAELRSTTLLPNRAARLGHVGFADWLARQSSAAG
jgi:uncharacterized protein YbjT (DUF2867 family)